MGYALERRVHPPIFALNQTALYVLMPSLIFTSLLKVDFTQEEPLRITAFAFLLALVLLAIAFPILPPLVVLPIGFALLRPLRLDRVPGSAFMLTAAFPNLGNYGLPVVLLAFGEPGLAAGTLVLAVQSLYSLTLAVFIASSSNLSIGRAAREVARQP